MVKEGNVQLQTRQFVYEIISYAKNENKNKIEKEKDVFLLSP